MDEAQFFDGQDVGVNDLKYMEDTRVADVAQRFSEVASSSGILFGLTITPNPLGSPYVLQINALNNALAGSSGVAYDPLGRDIRITVGDPLTQRQAPQQLSFAASDVGKLVTAAFTTFTDTPVQSPETGTPSNTRKHGVPTFQLRVVGTVPVNEVVLGTIATIDGSGNATIDFSSAQYWGARLTPIQLADITNAINEITLHQQRDHVDGIERVGSGGNPGFCVVDSSHSPNQLLVTQTVLGDSLLAGGTRLADANQLTGSPLLFTGPEVTLAPQLWAVSVLPTGVLEKTLFAQYPTQIQNVVGMQLVDGAPFGIPYPSPLLLNHQVIGGSHHIWLNGNSHVVVTGDGLYLLRTDADPDTAVLVYITAGTLPSSTSLLQDSVNTHPEIFDPASTEGRTLVMADGSTLLSFVLWQGNGFEFLGYGTWATTGAALDKRSFGNLDDYQLSDIFKSRLQRLLSETRADGFVSAMTIPTASGLVFPIDPSPGAGAHYAYIQGARVRVPRNASLTLPANSTVVVYLQSNGSGTATWGQQAGTGTKGVELAAGRMPVWNVTTGPSSVTSIVDVSVVLPQLDQSAAIIGRNNAGTLQIDEVNCNTLSQSPLFDVNANDLIPNLGLGASAKHQWLTSNVFTGQLTNAYMDAAGNLEIVFNAQWTQAASPNGWSKITTGIPAQLFRFGPTGASSPGLSTTAGIYVAQRIADGSWGNSGWDREQQSFGDLGIFGQGLLGTLPDAVTARLFVKRAADGVSPRTLIGRLPGVGLQGIDVYRSNRRGSIPSDPTTGGESLEFAINCNWDPLGSGWLPSDTSAGLNAAVVKFSRYGMAVANRLSTDVASGSPWADNSSGWTGGDPAIQLFWGNNQSGATAFKNTLSYGNIPKVIASLNFDGSGGTPTINVGASFGISSVAYNGSNVVRVTFATAFALADGFSVGGIVRRAVAGNLYVAGAPDTVAVSGFIQGVQSGLANAVDIKLVAISASGVTGNANLNSGSTTNYFQGSLDIQIYGDQ